MPVAPGERFGDASFVVSDMNEAASSFAPRQILCGDRGSLSTDRQIALHADCDRFTINDS
ncbi:hypothetical protein BSIN_2322 [Burkholderia singularis]|uniref:Uncharacterized protein n=1 Tax=Burkholderia singularis TaxID=1503053 RepID=A0A238H1I2_9BURK|nr:hypothetical protein BSIN_2322 [Burkholderia singularis]